MADLATELIAMGEEAFSARCSYAAFVRRDVDDDDSEFYTGVMSRLTLGMLQKDLELSRQPRLQEDGVLLLTDAGSKNGTYAHDHRLKSSEQVIVEDMQEVCLGPYRFLYMNAQSFLDSVKFWVSFKQ